MFVNRFKPIFLSLAMLGCTVLPAMAEVHVQCPGDTNGDARWTGDEVRPANTDCRHIASGDGFVTMGDRRSMYIFGFSDITGVLPSMAMHEGMYAATFSAPTLRMKEGENFYLTLTNVGMVNRPDLFDPHTVHFHGFPNAATVFDGEPMGSISINMGASLTYYYKIPPPGTYMYHCHVEATEHMQMGMLGNLYVTALQDDLPEGTILGTHVHHPDPDGNGPLPGDRYVYNDGDGSTRYDVDYPIQLVSFDPAFHDANRDVQPLPFAAMKDTYPMINGRGYPDTVDPAALPAPAENGGKVSQPISALITATRGQRILLRISSLSTVEFYTVGVLGLPMKVVGKDAQLLRGPDPDGSGPLIGKNTSYSTGSVTLGGGEAVDVILDTAEVAPGTYFLHVKNLNNLSNNTEDFGGMMTEIVIL